MTVGTTAMATRLQELVWGEEDPRVRATWRFLLAWPLLPLVGALVGLAMPVLGVSGMIPGGPLQGIVLVGISVRSGSFASCIQHEST